MWKFKGIYLYAGLHVHVLKLFLTVQIRTITRLFYLCVWICFAGGGGGGGRGRLKGKFSSGIEGALASTLNCDFNWKQLSEMIPCIFYLTFSKFIWVTLIQKQQKYFKKETLNFGRGRRTLLWFEIYTCKMQVLKALSFPGCLTCKYCVPINVKNTWKQCCLDRCVVVSLKFELNESIIKRLIKHLFHTFWLLFRLKSKCGCPISSKIT